MKAILMTKENIAEIHIVHACPNCEENVIKLYDNFCSVCGTKLKWDKTFQTLIVKLWTYIKG